MWQRFWLALRNLNEQYYFDYFLVFLIGLVLFGWLQAAPTLAEPDSFYHAKMAQIAGSGQILHVFPWLQQTPLKSVFVDHHFLYHIFLIPFVKWLDPLLGVKLATVIFAAFAVLTVYWLFKQFKLKYPFLFLVFLLLCQPWLFRASLVKAPVVFLIFLLLAFYCLAHQKWLGLFLISFSGVWLYGAWPLLLVMAVLYAAINWFLEKIRREESIWYKIRDLLRKKRTVAWPGALYTLGGIIAGLVINPYFPANIKFYGQQIIDIALINYQKVIAVGGEWYPYGFLHLISDAPLICALLLASLLLFVLTVSKQSIYSWVWGILAVVFLIFTLKSRRQVEFFAPCTVIFAAFCFNDYFKKLSAFHLRVLLSMGWQTFFAVSLLVLGAGFVLQAPSNLIRAKQDLSNGWPITHYQKSAGWLKNNAPAGAIVFNADWDDFPALFYYNSQNYYLSGLDPTFMYRENPSKYQQYVKISLGEVQQNLDQLIGGVFNASYVFLDQNHGNFKRQLEYNGHFKKVYEDSEALIYQLVVR
ncbi:MAG: hypothetical protein NTZ18_00180 [Candidatus Komeilibacteria bacterium]|nr:hypothetical protein [Candidatus Komeilibacteria bacterium]